MDGFPQMPKRSVDLPLGCKDLADAREIHEPNPAQWRQRRVADQLAYMEGYLAQLIESTGGSYGLWLSRFQDHGMVGVVCDSQLHDQVLIATWRSIVQQRNLAAYFGDVSAVAVQPRIGRWKTRHCMIYRLPADPTAAAGFAGQVFRGGYGFSDTSVIYLDYH